MLRRAALCLHPTHKVTEHGSLQPETRIKQLFNTKGCPDLSALSTQGFVFGGCDPEAAVASTPPLQTSPAESAGSMPSWDPCHLALHHSAGKATEESKVLNYNKLRRPGKGGMQQSNLQAQFSDHEVDTDHCSTNSNLLDFPLQNSGFFL